MSLKTVNIQVLDIRSYLALIVHMMPLIKLINVKNVIKYLNVINYVTDMKPNVIF